MSRVKELARCGSLVCGSAGGQIRSVSPDETSRWCRSLASCGVRGHLLSSLQGTILERQIDGKQFDEMLRTGGLLNIGLPDMNPRLIGAIRKAWNTDFGQMRLIPHCTHTQTNAGVNDFGSHLATNSRPPLPRSYGSARETTSHRLDTIADASKRASSAGPTPVSGSLRPGQYAPECEVPMERLLPLSSSDIEDSLDALLPAKPRAQTSFAPPQPVVPTKNRSTCEERRTSDVAFADVFAPRAKAANTFAANPGNEGSSVIPNPTPQMQRHPCAALDSVLPPKAPVTQQCEADDRYARVAPRRAPAHQTEQWGGISLGDALKPQQPAQQRYASNSDVQNSQLASKSRANTSGWDGASLGDVLAPRKAARTTFRTEGTTHDENGGIRDPAPAQVQQACPDDALNPIRTPMAEKDQPRRRAGASGHDGWEGVSLGDAMPARTKPATPPPAEPRSRRQKNSRGSDLSTECNKSQQQIVEWLRSLPVSHVPEQAREGIVQIVEETGLSGNAFTEFVQKVDPSVCGPKHAMKLKAAWINVLGEAAATEVCRQNLDYAANHAQKAVAVQIAA